MTPPTTDPSNDVLVVDDDDDVREILRLQLEAAGFSTRVAENGADALAQVTRQRPAVVLLDMMMPVMSGAEFLEAIRRDERLRDLPVVVITAWPQEARCRHCSTACTARSPDSRARPCGWPASRIFLREEASSS